MAQNKNKSRKIYLRVGVGLYYWISSMFSSSGNTLLESNSNELTIALLIIIGIVFLVGRNILTIGSGSAQNALGDLMQKINTNTKAPIQVTNKTNYTKKSKITSISGDVEYGKNTSKRMSIASNEVYSPYSLDGK